MFFYPAGSCLGDPDPSQQTGINWSCLARGLLLSHQRSEVVIDAGQVKQPAAMHITPATQTDRLDLAFVDQVVEGAALDTEEALDVLPATKFGEGCALSSGCDRYRLSGHRVHIVSSNGSSQLVRRLLQVSIFSFSAAVSCRHNLLRKWLSAYYNYLKNRSEN